MKHLYSIQNRFAYDNNSDKKSRVASKREIFRFNIILKWSNIMYLRP